MVAVGEDAVEGCLLMGRETGERLDRGGRSGRSWWSRESIRRHSTVPWQLRVTASDSLNLTPSEFTEFTRRNRVSLSVSLHSLDLFSLGTLSRHQQTRPQHILLPSQPLLFLPLSPSSSSPRPSLVPPSPRDGVSPVRLRHSRPSRSHPPTLKRSSRRRAALASAPLIPHSDSPRPPPPRLPLWRPICTLPLHPPPISPRPNYQAPRTRLPPGGLRLETDGRLCRARRSPFGRRG